MASAPPPAAAIQVDVVARGTAAGATIAQNGSSPALKGAKYLRVSVGSDVNVYEMLPIRAGAHGHELFVLPGQFGLAFGASAAGTARPVTVWANRRAQLNSINGRLVLTTLVAALGGACIDGSFALWTAGWHVVALPATTYAALAAVSVACKIVTPIAAFLLALWFKKS